MDDRFLIINFLLYFNLNLILSLLIYLFPFRNLIVRKNIWFYFWFLLDYFWSFHYWRFRFVFESSKKIASLKFKLLCSFNEIRYSNDQSVYFERQILLSSNKLSCCYFHLFYFFFDILNFYNWLMLLFQILNLNWLSFWC